LKDIKNNYCYKKASLNALGFVAIYVMINLADLADWSLESKQAEYKLFNFK
jgi:hypothetical protein